MNHTEGNTGWHLRDQFVQRHMSFGRQQPASSDALNGLAKRKGIRKAKWEGNTAKRRIKVVTSSIPQRVNYFARLN